MLAARMSLVGVALLSYRTTSQVDRLRAMPAEAKTAAPTTPATEVPASKTSQKGRAEAEAVGDKRKQSPKEVVDVEAQPSKHPAKAGAATKQTGLMAFFPPKSKAVEFL